MTNEELKKKIVEIINAIEDCSMDIPCLGCEYDKERREFNNIACHDLRVIDALIAAGIGDISELEAKREELKLASEYYTNELKGAEKLIKKAERRAEIAERALKIAEELGELCAPCKHYIKQAEKELRRRGRDEG